jgi:predicted enzyme related to lactoylglutathione lyase
MTDPAPAPAIDGVAALAIDCADPEVLAAFWAALLGGAVELDDDGNATLRPPGGPVIDFFRVPDAKIVKNRLHLDLRSRDLNVAVDQALRLGATRADDVYDGGRWQVLRDPEGNEFCILRPRPASS